MVYSTYIEMVFSMAGPNYIGDREFGKECGFYGLGPEILYFISLETHLCFARFIFFGCVTHLES